MGKQITMADAATVLGLGEIETLSDSDGNSLGIAVQGTVVVTFLETMDSHLQATVHDHDSAEEAQQCAADVLAQIGHGLAEREAWRNDPTVALSQLDPSVSFMVI